MKWSFGYAHFLMQDGGFVWGYSLINIASASLIASALAAPRMFDWQPLVRIGVISYGIYVYHIPVLRLIEQTEMPRMLMFPFFVLTTYTIAEASFRWVETPFLRLKDRSSRQGNSALVIRP